VGPSGLAELGDVPAEHRLGSGAATDRLLEGAADLDRHPGRQRRPGEPAARSPVESTVPSAARIRPIVWTSGRRPAVANVA
jgi:hypothetical protein